MAKGRGCKFCDAERSLREIHENMDGSMTYYLRAAIVVYHRMEGQKSLGSHTTYYGRHGYSVNYCPECGRRVEKWAD